MPKLTDIYQNGMSPEALAASVLRSQGIDIENPHLPIDPFRIMRRCGVVYQFIGAKNLEGIYLVPEDEKDVPLVGINCHRPITRQRFSAAHELCHHLKDRSSQICPIGANQNAMEKYAEQFASALLMPLPALRQRAARFLQDEQLDLQAALHLSVEFGVSFGACARKLAYVLRVLPFENPKELGQRIKKFKPDKVKAQLGIELEPWELLAQAADSYEFFYQIRPDIAWYIFKNNFIFNENRMEGVDLEEDEVAEIVADLRLHGGDSEYCRAEYDNIIQVTGHSAIYDYICSTQDNLDIYKLTKLNRLLFQYTPVPDTGGSTRRHNVMVQGASFEAADWRDIMPRLIKLAPVTAQLLERREDCSVSEFISEAVKIHHEITQIHPFADGNGRCSRAFLNWLLRLKGLPPIYIKHKEKERYYEALTQADTKGDFRPLAKIVIKELFRTMMEINKH